MGAGLAARGLRAWRRPKFCHAESPVTTRQCYTSIPLESSHNIRRAALENTAGVQENGHRRWATPGSLAFYGRLLLGRARDGYVILFGRPAHLLGTQAPVPHL